MTKRSRYNFSREELILAILLLVDVVNAQYASWEKSAWVVLPPNKVPVPAPIGSSIASQAFLVDGCKNHVVLSNDLWRSGPALSRGTNYGCSSVRTTFSTWYRFEGLSGVEVLKMSKCVTFPYSSCQWIPAHVPGYPLPDGSVAHLSCWSDATRCHCDQTYVLSKACNGYTVYWIQDDMSNGCGHRRFCGMDPNHESSWFISEPLNNQINKSWYEVVRRNFDIPPNILKSDGCANYKSLSDPERSVYRAGCPSDKVEEPGWYRFDGIYGEELLYSCPATLQNAEHNCLWAVRETDYADHPAGVKRVHMCSSHYRSCECVNISQSFVRDCGAYKVYWLNDKDSCDGFYSRQYCAQPNSYWTDSSFNYSISCESDRMQVILNTKYYVDSVTSVRLADGTCPAVVLEGNLVRIRIQYSERTCGTSVTMTDSEVTFSNSLSVIGMTGIDEIQTLVALGCTYPRDVSAKSYASFRIVDTATGLIDGVGSFRVTLKLGPSTDTIFSKNTQLKADDKIFAKLEFVSDQKMYLSVRECFAAPTPFVEDPVTHIIVNQTTRSCYTDASWVNTSDLYPWPSQGFSYRVRRITPRTITVYVHCKVFVCVPGQYSPECQPICSAGRTYNASTNGSAVIAPRARRELGTSVHPRREFFLSSGPFLIPKEEQSVSESHLVESGPKVSTVLVVGLALAGVATITLVGLYFRRKSRVPVELSAKQALL